MQYLGSSGPGLRRQFYKYLLPSIGAMWFFSIYTMIDGIFVGKGVGPNALAAVNLSMPFISTVFALALLFSVGGSTLITFNLGKRDYNNSNKIFTLTLILVMIVSIFISLIALINLDSLVNMLGSSSQTAPYVKDYLRIIIIFSPFFMLAYTLEILVKADGNPGHSLILVFISAVINIVLDYVLVIKYNYGIKGAAVATGISQMIACIGYLTHFILGKAQLKIVKPDFSFDYIKSIIKLGFPESLTEFSGGFATFMFNFAIIRYLNSDAIAAFSVIMYMNNLVLSTMVAINQGVQPLISFYHGKADGQCIKKLSKLTIKSAIIWSLFFFILSRLLTAEIVSLFISHENTELYNISVQGLKLYSYSFLIAGFNIIISGFLTAIKNSGSAMIVSTLRGYVTISFTLLVLPIMIGSQGIWLSAIISELLTIIISIIILRRDLPKLRTSMNKFRVKAPVVPELNTQ
ncbi:MATE family efflux transporter [Microaceticoccus formicicus]|uniref:MATE family efflux transporter n=1 Tax=Microaceticoccus formicicus TaxID=3118105 RepID=UPI003CD05069|nr:MATE family efflux transporter [Peptoniphilaceae bacterium AMB_02]